MNTQLYDYTTCPLQRNQIRLLSLKNTSRVASGGWTLEIVNLDDPQTSYVALSYRWGAPLHEPPFENMTDERCHHVSCDDQSIQVTSNLLGFLKQVENDQDLAQNKFWIDGVCINQGDDEERARQISIMAQIYKLASYVIAWLGDADPITERGFYQAKELAGGNTLPPFGSNSSVHVGHTGWQASTKLFQRTYWNRAWIIQELVLAKKAIVRCGRYSADFRMLAMASQQLSAGTWGGIFHRRGVWQHDEVARLLTTPAQNEQYCIPTALEATRAALKEEHWTNILLYSLIRSRNFESKFPEDKVYSLLGLIQDSVNTDEMPLLRPNYKDGPAKAYLNLALQLLRDSNDLLLLTCVEGRPFQPLSNIVSLPSWVPDWSCRRPLGLRVTGYKRYSADACFDVSGIPLSPSEKLQRWPTVVGGTGLNLTLTLRGFEVDRISFVGEAKRRIRQGRPFPKLLAILESLPRQHPITGEDKLEVLWRTLIANTAGQDRVAPEQASTLAFGFAKWLQERVHQVTNKSDQEWEDRKRIFATFCDTSALWAKFAGGRDDRDAAEYASAFSHGLYLRPFLTENNYLGLGTENLREGDAIYVVPRCMIPLIFRGTTESMAAAGHHCELVGGCYLHGFMDGKVLVDIATRDGFSLNNSALQSIVIH